MKQGLPDYVKPLVLNDTARTTLEQRYLLKNDNLEVIEDAAEMFYRVANNIAQADKTYDKNADLEKITKEFYDLMTNFYFLPNSPTLMNAGRELQQLSACFVLPIDDSIGTEDSGRGIYDVLKYAAIVSKSGGGTGFSFSRLRPRNSPVKKTKGVASGPVSFMKIYDSSTEQVKQGGTRRGANMGVLRVDHPDILDFIYCKQEEKDLENFNISVAATEEFMQAVKNGSYYRLYEPHTKEYTRKEDLINRKNTSVGSSEPSLIFNEEKNEVINTYNKEIIGIVDKNGYVLIDAKKVFSEIARIAWKNGDPGIIFIDRINEENPTPALGNMESTNPCGEQPLLPYECCNLGSINLSKMVKEDEGSYSLDWKKFKEVIHTAVHFLDNVIDMNEFPLREIKKKTLGNRKIGLGIMGFHDMLIRLGIKYNSQEALETAKKIMKFIQYEGRLASIDLAEKRGTFQNYEKSIYNTESKHYKGLELKLRNATVTTIAPTGTISIIAGVSSGIEPIINVAYRRNVKSSLGKDLFEVNSVFEELAKEYGFYSLELINKIFERKTVNGIDEIPKGIQDLFQNALEISLEAHIKMQAAFQKHTDNAVSKTVNLPGSATIDDVIKAYMLAYDLGCKGVTIYRDGSKSSQVLTTGKTANEKLMKLVEEVIEGKHVMLKEKLSSSYTIETGEGKIHITITHDERGYPLEIFENIGPIGSSKSTNASVDGLRLSRYLQDCDEPDLIKIYTDYGSAKSDNPVGFGPNRIDSIQHGFAISFLRHCLKWGIFKYDENRNLVQVVFKENNSELKEKKSEQNVQLENPACPVCGSRNTHFTGGCREPTCKDCGYSVCS